MLSGNYPMQGPVPVDEIDNEIKMVRYFIIYVRLVLMFYVIILNFFRGC